jgi:hypothetical protein
LNTKLTIQLLTIFVTTLSLAVVPGTMAANATIVSTPGTNPNTQWIGSGPAADTIRLQYYTGLTGDTNEYNALCFAQPTTCNPQIDLTDVQVPTSEVSPTNNNDPRFYVTPESPAFDFEHVDFNLANSFFGVEFCNGADGITIASTCPDGIGASAIPATCPNMPAPHTGDCTFAGISIRQGVAHLIDKAAYVSNVLLNHGVAIDNVLAAAQNTLHSGQNFNPLFNPTGTTPANIGPYAVDPTNPIGSQQVALGSETQCVTVAQINGNGGHCEINVGGVCSWDVLIGCAGTFQGQTQLSAFHLTGDPTADANGMVPTGSPDFCAAATDFVNAGIGTSVSTPATGCQINGFTGFNTGTAGTPGGPLLLYRRVSLDRGPMFDGLGTSICRLIHGPTGTENCLEVTVQTISLAQAHVLVFNQGCKSASEAGTTCASQGPKRTWTMYDGGNTLAVTVNNLYALYTSQFASDLCGGNSPGDQPLNYVLSCNTKLDTWSNYGEFTGTPGNAVADTQIANDIFGNHTFSIPFVAHSSQYAWLSGWGGVSNAAGIGIAQGNFYGLLNAYNPNPAVAGPTIRWGQKDSPASLNPFSANSVIEFDIIQEIYDTLLASNAYSPSSLYSYMVNSYQIVLNSQDSNCPLNVSTASGTFAVAGCVKMALRGDNSWHDIYNCAPTDGACLQGHTVTAQDVKFSFASYNATGGLITPSTQNTVDVLYNPSSLPSAAFSAYGGTQSSGQPEIIYFALKSLSAWQLFDIATVPIVPQHVWKTATAAGPCLSPTLGGATVSDIYAGTPACSLDTSFVSGPGSDPIANNKLIGSSAFMCTSGTVGASGTVYGGGCSTSGNQSPAAGDVVTLRRFQYQGTNAAQQGSLNVNFAYFRTNGKFKNFAWADYLSARNSGQPNGLGAQGVVDIRDIQSVASCLHVAPPYTTAPCNHWASAAATTSLVSTSGGANLGVVGGGRGTTVQVSIGTVSQVSRWYLTQFYDQQLSTASPPSPLLYGTNGNQLNPGSYPAPGSGQNVLYEDATNETS